MLYATFTPHKPPSGDTPMAYTTIQPSEPIEPKDPIDPTYCPTCLSGTPPRDEEFDAAIRVG